MSDLISKKAVIQDIEDLLESPYAHSQFGEVSKEVGFIVRKDMAGTIIDLCIKRAEIAYDVDKVVEGLELENKRLKTLKNNCIALSDHEVCAVENKAYGYAIKLVNRGGKDE